MFKPLLSMILSLTVLVQVPVQASVLADPMQPPSIIPSKKISDSAERRWFLTSTLIGDGRRNATINGKLVEVGERVDGATVLDIQPAMVKLRYQEKIMVIKLLPSIVKKLK